MKNHILKQSLINASLTALYIVLVGCFLFYGQNLLPMPHEPSVIYPIGILLLFVFSASICGALVLGRPVLWYLDGKKQDAIRLFAYTMASFFVIALVIFVILYFVAVG